MPSSLIVYKASAGSGKTFTLAVQYIKLLIMPEQPNAYRHILAVTFTNKATSEMKDRILQQLYGIWKSLDSSQSYFNVLQEELEREHIVLTENEIRKRAGQALQQILHDYSRFRVETIDSFFQSVMKNLAHELNLTANLRVDLNDKEVLSTAVDRIMERLHLTPLILNWILEYVDDRIRNNERWDIAREVKGFAGWIFKEAYLTKEQELRKALQEHHLINELRKELTLEIQSGLDTVQSAVEHFREELEAYHITCQLFSRGSTLDTYLTRISQGNLAAEFGNTLQKYLTGPDQMLKKADQKDASLMQIATHFHELLTELRKFQEENLPRHTSATLALKHLNPLRLLGVIDEEVTALNNENNRFLLAKTPILLNELIEENDAPFIFEKMGSFFHHVMIDEFQDTSTLQWKNFKILLTENLSTGYGNLIVGDVKQSIYRWRNGDWTILNNIQEEMGAHVPDVRNLAVNHRSERRIISFNNLFFRQAAEAIDRIAPQAAIRLEDAYADVRQDCPPHRENKGFVRIRFYDHKKNVEEDWETSMLADLCEQVTLLHEQGLPYSSMAILLRKRAHALPVIRYFAEHLPGIKLVSDEAFLLSSSLSVCMLIAALRYLADDTDRISLSFLLLHYSHEVLRQPADINRLLVSQPEAHLPQDFFSRREELITLPLYELQEELFRMFELERITDQDAYLFAYFDQVIGYLQDNPSDIGSFLKYWDEVLSAQSIPSGEVDGIRIFTIHKSKGLQFHTVFAPYCHWDIEKDRTGFSRQNDLLWCEPHEAPYNKLPLIPITIEGKMKDSIFHAEYEEEHLQRRVDALNTLYVAFTRAEKNLYAWSKTKYTLDENSTVGDVLYQALPTQLEGAETEEGENGEISVFTYGSAVGTHTAKMHESDNRMELSYTPEPVFMQNYAARIDFCQSGKAEEFLEEMAGNKSAVSRMDSRRTGILMHKIFSTIYTREDVEKAVLQLETEGLISTLPEKDALKRQVETAFGLPEITRWFDGSMKLYNECPILTQKYDATTGKYQSYRPDRVMMSHDTLIVVDFKFGQAHPDYRKQVAEYMTQLKLMEPAKKVKGYLWYIVHNKLEEIQA